MHTALQGSRVLPGDQQSHLRTGSLLSKEQLARDKAAQWTAGTVGNHMKKPNSDVQCMVRNAKNVAETIASQLNVKHARNIGKRNLYTRRQNEKKHLCIKVVTENVNEVDTKRVNDSQLFASMLMDNNIIKFQTDCGAACNITPISWLNPDTKLSLFCLEED